MNKKWCIFFKLFIMSVIGICCFIYILSVFYRILNSVNCIIKPHLLLPPAYFPRWCYEWQPVKAALTHHWAFSSCFLNLVSFFFRTFIWVAWHSIALIYFRHQPAHPWTLLQWVSDHNVIMKFIATSDCPQFSRRSVCCYITLLNSVQHLSGPVRALFMSLMLRNHPSTTELSHHDCSSATPLTCKGQ